MRHRRTKLSLLVAGAVMVPASFGVMALSDSGIQPRLDSDIDWRSSSTNLMIPTFSGKSRKGMEV
jgi:hypothetical protein